MKIIFLDFDGVINNWYHFDGVCIENALILKEIIGLTNAKIVVTSSNKYQIQNNPQKDYKQTKYFKEYIQKLNEIGIEIYNITPYCNYNRTIEIQKYILEHNIESFVIIDDELVSDVLQEHQVFCDLYRGLQIEHIEPTLKILNGELGFYPENYNRKETSSELILRINKHYNNIK